MPKSTSFPDIVDQTSYGNAYYLGTDDTPQNTFNFRAEQTLPRAQAMAETAEIEPGDKVLDFGCGLGAMTVAFNRLGYDATGLDPSQCALNHALPEAAGSMYSLGDEGLDTFGDDTFELAVAKDVFEHVPEDEILDLSTELMRVARKLLLIIPTAGENGRFIFDLYEQDPTHITRLTRDGWLDLFSRLHTSVLECPDLTPRIRRRDKVMGTVCILLTQLDNQ